jgi:hypothetical protein
MKGSGSTTKITNTKLTRTEIDTETRLIEIDDISLEASFTTRITLIRDEVRNMTEIREEVRNMKETRIDTVNKEVKEEMFRIETETWTEIEIMIESEILKEEIFRIEIEIENGTEIISSVMATDTEIKIQTEEIRKDGKTEVIRIEEEIMREILLKEEMTTEIEMLKVLKLMGMVSTIIQQR